MRQQALRQAFDFGQLGGGSPSHSFHFRELGFQTRDDAALFFDGYVGNWKRIQYLLTDRELPGRRRRCLLNHCPCGRKTYANSRKFWVKPGFQAHAN